MSEAIRRQGFIFSGYPYIFLLLLLSGTLAASEFPYRFEYITTDEGLSQNTVDYIYKDSRGFMWFATWNGLCRYDGYEFQTFKSENHGSGLPDNFVHTIAEDANGLLWVGTAKGVGVFDLSYGRFCRLEGLPPELRQKPVNALYKGPEGNMWVGAEDVGLTVVSVKRYNPRSGLLQLDARQTILQEASVTAITAINKEKMLVGARNEVWEMSWMNKVFRPLAIQSLITLPSAQVLALYAEEDYIWIGTTHGLIQYRRSDRQERTFLHNPSNPEGLLHNTITTISRDKENNILIGGLGGLNIYQPKFEKFLSITEGKKNRRQLNNKFINSIFTDDFGNVWIGTEKGGVNKYNLYQNKFDAIIHDDAIPNSLSHSTVNSILIEEQTLWVGTAGGGLNQIDRKSKQITHFRHNPRLPQSISSDFITSILRDQEGNLWLGSWGHGLNKLPSGVRENFEHYLPNLPQADSLFNSFISSIEEDPRGFLLVGTEGGLGLLDPVSDKIRNFPREKTGVSISEVGCILRSRNNYYWIGTRKGLFRFPAVKIDKAEIRLQPEDVQFFNANGRKDRSLPGNYITSLHEDQSGRIWIGTYGHGVAYCNPRGAQDFSFHAYDEENGLCNNVVYGIENDAGGRLWLSTDYGLSCFDPESEKFKNYFTSDGLLSNQFYWSASSADRKGNLYFGGLEGLNFFNPEDIHDYPYKPEAAFTKLVVLNEAVAVGEKRHGKTPLSTLITDAQTINLSHKDNIFSIEFSTLDYFLPEKVQFAYQMEGVDKDWVQAPASRRFASYTNLSGGEYKFRVKASNGDGLWQEIPTELLFIIHPPFWSTGWFRLVLLVVLSGGVFGYIRWRIHYLRSQTKKLERLVDERTQEIEQQKERLRLQAESLKDSNLMLEQRQSQIESQKQELETKNLEISKQRDQLIELNQKVRLVNQLRLRFFTNISHEFRTPLTLIIDPIEHLLERFNGDGEVRRTLHIINRNAQRLLHLINQLMNFRRLEEGKAKARVAKGNLVNFIKDIYLSFQDLAEHQKIQYHFHMVNPQKRAWFDAEKLENILYNLLSNAFKYTPKKGKVSLALAFETWEEQGKTPSYFELKVSDTGLGIEQEHQQFIFDHFYQSPSSNKSQIKGSGIGLALTRELVEILHGDIAVDSEPGRGSVFTVRLPYSRNAFSEAEIVETEISRPPNLVTQVAAIKEDIILSQRVEKNIKSPNEDKEKPLILVVEDNYDLRAFLTQSLSGNYRIIEAGHGKEGYEFAKKYTPDLIVSDIMMPHMDGLELCSRLKNHIQTSHIPVILLTAKTLVTNWVDGLETGADDYVPKPFNLRILVARIDNLIRSRRQMKLLFSKDPAPSPKAATSNSVDEKFLQNAYDVLEVYYAEQKFSQDQFAHKMCMSRSLLYKKIKSLTDMSVTDFINFFKLKKAAQMLQEPGVSISEVAYQTGFTDPKYFSRMFKKFYGMSPSNYASRTPGKTNVNPEDFESRLN